MDGIESILAIQRQLERVMEIPSNEILKVHNLINNSSTYKAFEMQQNILKVIADVINKDLSHQFSDQMSKILLSHEQMLQNYKRDLINFDTMIPSIGQVAENLLIVQSLQDDFMYEYTELLAKGFYSRTGLDFLKSLINQLTTEHLHDMISTLLTQYNSYDNHEDVATADASKKSGDSEASIELGKDVYIIVSDMLSNKNWQTGLDEKYKKWKAKNPVIANIFVMIINALIGTLFGLFFNFFFVTKQTTTMREEPSTKSTKIIEVPQNSTVLILSDNLSYYYEIYYSDEQGNEYNGFVSKRSIGKSSASNAVSISEIHTSPE